MKTASDVIDWLNSESAKTRSYAMKLLVSLYRNKLAPPEMKASRDPLIDMLCEANAMRLVARKITEAVTNGNDASVCDDTVGKELSELPAVR